MSSSVRHSLIAGQWYPGDANQLRRFIQAQFDRVETIDVHDEIVGLISPHAGYTYSGQVAAYAYHQARNQSFDTVVVLSPVHRMPLGRFAITSADAYETPLGLVHLDTERIRALETLIPVHRVSYDGEHSLEIQLPFLQVALGEVHLLPIMIGDPSFDAAQELGEALPEILKDRKALIVASSDLHHIENYDEVVRRDQVVIDAIDSFDMARIQAALSPWDCTVCGRIPIYAMLTAAHKLGATRVQVLQHTTSGDVTNQRTPGQYTVGYMAAAVYRELS